MPSGLAQKLRIKDGYRIAVVNAPRVCRESLEPLSESVLVADSLDGTFDLIWYFGTTRDAMLRDVQAVRDSITPSGLIWLTYPKGTSGVPTDLKRDVMWEVGRHAGLETVAQIAVDNVWTSLRFKIVT
jgi:hypothetical protein